MRNIDEVLNAIVEEGFTTTVFFIPILLVVLGLFNVLGLSLISGFFLSVAIATAFFSVRIYLRLGGRVISKRSVKEAVLVGLISSIPHLAYVAFLELINGSLSSVLPTLAFLDYLMWRYYKSLDGEVCMERVVKWCVLWSIFNLTLGTIYALTRGVGLNLMAWFSCWIGFAIALISLKPKISNALRV